MVRYCDRCLRALTSDDTYLTFLGSGTITTPKGLDTTYYMKKKSPTSKFLNKNIFYITPVDENHPLDICADCIIELINFCKEK